MAEIISDNKNLKLDLNDTIQKLSSCLVSRFSKTPIYYHVHSYGCQANVSEGETIVGVLDAAGLKKTADLSKADVIVLNACAVRKSAQDRVIGNLGFVVKQKRDDPKKIIVLCGCMFQQSELSKSVANTFKEVDLIFGALALNKFPSLLLHILERGERVICTPKKSELLDENLPKLRDEKVNALVPISYGCDNFCSYCIVPYVKGRERSRKSDDIVNEVKSLILKGYKQITLLGQNVNSYGASIDGEINFPALLRKLNNIDGDFRIRFFTSHPKDATKELIDTIKECKKVCKHLHLPFQSGSDRILAAMNRKYTKKDYIDLINYAKSTIKGMTFSSDVIVGFPGEEEKDFEKTLELVKEVEFLSLFTFIYSKRPHTPAATMEDHTKKEIKSKRLTRLIDLQNQISEKLHLGYIGKVERILIEGESRVNPAFLTGRTDTHLVVDVEAKQGVKAGDFVDVLIEKAFRMALRGKILQ